MLYIILHKGEYMDEEDHLPRTIEEVLFILFHLEEFNKSLQDI